LAAAAMGTVFGVSAAKATFTFDNIENWVGSGASRAALVIDWNDGIQPVSLAWGYRWDGPATGKDMLDAIVNADPRLMANYKFSGGALYGAGYDVDGDGFTYVPGPNDTGAAADADDHYREGWEVAGYWSYWGNDTTQPSPYGEIPASWVYPGAGMALRALSDGSWDGWVFAPAPTWDGGTPDVPEPAAVPEPITALLLAVPLAAMRRRRFGRCRA
jgi:hypothetical protein